MTSEQQDKLIKFLTVIFPHGKVYLFGSRARGTHKPTSDFDIAIDNGERISVHLLEQARNVIDALNIVQKVDVSDFQALPEDMREDILKE